jgi:hypothetical protein
VEFRLRVSRDVSTGAPQGTWLIIEFGTPGSNHNIPLATREELDQWILPDLPCWPHCIGPDECAQLCEPVLQQLEFETPTASDNDE